jgi:hypothetical protein
MRFPPVRASGYPYAAYDPYEIRPTTRQINGQQIKPLLHFSHYTRWRKQALAGKQHLFYNQNLNIMNLFFLHPTTKNLKEQPDKHTLVHSEPTRNTDEGSEFLDDAIRMEDLPLFYSEESVAAESPQNLL